MYSDIKMIAADLDGTLLNPQAHLSENTRRILQKAHEAGIRIVIASGRPRCALPEDILNVPFLRYAITSNGASIFDLASGRRLYACDLPRAKTERIIEICRPDSCACEVFAGGCAYAARTYWENPSADAWRRHYVQSTRQPVDDMTSFIRAHAGGIEGFHFIFEEAARQTQIRQALQAEGGLYVTSFSASSIEIENGCVSKAAACALLADHFHIRQQQVAAFGDSLNDLEMLQYAGLGVAMSNACAALRQKADAIAPSNAQDGAAGFIEQQILRI